MKKILTIVLCFTFTFGNVVASEREGPLPTKADFTHEEDAGGGGNGTCSSTSICTIDGRKYGTVSCTGEKSCTTGYNAVYCDGQVSRCVYLPAR